MSDPKPGELWWVRCDDAEMTACYDGECEWYILETREFREATHIRRLIVLDPESADDVERVREAIGLSAESLIPAKMLRGLATPPEMRMEEPTELGAVVVDGNGIKWVRADQGNDPCAWFCSDPFGWTKWTRIPSPIRLATDEERGA